MVNGAFTGEFGLAAVPNPAWEKTNMKFETAERETDEKKKIKEEINYQQG